MKSLQEQYNQIKIGKGSKEIFLKEAKALFPQYIPNPMGFDSAIVILKQRSVITESSDVKEYVKPTNSFEQNFAKFLAEGKKKEQGIKADLKKTDKSVEKVNDEANYDNEDTKTADNVIFDQYMRGIYTEMSKDPKQDLEAVKKKVLKNLTKDPLYYLKNGQFGLDGVGYTDELPGAELSKSDQMVPASKTKDKTLETNVKDTLGKKERAKGNPDKVKIMSTATKNSKGVKKMAPPSKGKIIKLKENQTLESLFEEAEGGIYDDFNKAKEFIKEYALATKKILPIIKKAYETKNFKGLGDVIFQNAKKYASQTGTEDFFKDWISGIDNESLGIKSSGSFYTALTDSDWIESNFENFDSDELEELSNVWNSIVNNKNLYEGANSFKDKVRANYDEIVKTFDEDSQDLEYDDLIELWSKLLDAPISQVEKFYNKILDFQDDAPEEPNTGTYLDRYLGKSSVNEGKKGIPKGWSEEKDINLYNDESGKETYGGEVIKAYSAPMEGWDEYHTDEIKIIKKEDGNFGISAYYSFSGEDEELKKESFNSLEAAQKRVVEVMKEIMESWDDENMVEGALEDADATLAKQEADAEAKAAALAKQRADNKTKIAAANKNI